MKKVKETAINTILMIILSAVLAMLLLGLWGVFGRGVQLFVVAEIVLGILFLLVRFGENIWRVLTNRSWDK